LEEGAHKAEDERKDFCVIEREKEEEKRASWLLVLLFQFLLQLHFLFIFKRPQVHHALYISKEIY